MDFASGQLEQGASARDPSFLCPGQSLPVSRAVHLARLNAAWSVCDECEWRQHTEGLSTQTVIEAERIRDHRMDGIRRTEFGVRGQYVNFLTRSTAADLARIFSACFVEDARRASVSAARNSPEAVQTRTSEMLRLIRNSSSIAEPASERSPADSFAAVVPYQTGTQQTLRNQKLLNENRLNDAASLVRPSRDEIPPLVVGYDSRSSSPDLFVGVVAAVREFGIPVIDVGRCTHASLQAAVRHHDGCQGALIVTGAGMPASWTGLDAVDSFGDPVPVVWKNFAVRLQHVPTSSTQTSEQRGDEAAKDSNRRSLSTETLSSDDSGIDELLRRIRGELENSETTVPFAASLLRIDLPEQEARRSWARRLSRESGAHQVVAFEDTYRAWLLRWFPASAESRIVIRANDDLVHRRVEWLAEQTGIELLCRPLTGEVPASRFSVLLGDDDRDIQFFGRRGDLIPPERLALQMNRAIQSETSHVTAHGDDVTGRFWLSDLARVGASQHTDRVRDGLVIVGVITRLIESGQLNLG